MFEKKNFTEKTGNFTDVENKKFVDTEKVMNNGAYSSTQQSSQPFSETTSADLSQAMNISGETSAIIPDQNVMFAQKDLSGASQPNTQPIGASFTPDNVFSDSSINRLESSFQQNQTSFTEQNHMQFSSNARVAFSDNVGKQFSDEERAHFYGANMPKISNSGNNEMPLVASKDNFNAPDSKFKNTEIDTFKSHETSFDAKHLDHIKNVPKMDKVAYDSNPALGHVTSTSAIYHKDVKIEFGENSVQKGDRIVMKKGPFVKAHIRFNGKENRTFADHASKFIDTVSNLQKDNEAAASNADDYIATVNRLELNFQQNQTSFTEQNHMQFSSNARVAFSDNVGKQFSGEGKAHFSGANMPEISNSGNNEMPSVTSKDNFNAPDSKFKNTEIDTFKSHETSFDAKHLDHIKNVPKMDKVAYDSNPALGHVTSTSAISHKDVKIEFGENSVQKGNRIVMKKGPSVKAHIRFDGKEKRTFTDRASKFIDTVSNLQKDNEAAASNADDYVATVIDTVAAKEMRTVQDYKAIEKEAKRDIKAADKAEKTENKSIKKAEKFKDKAETRFKTEASELKKASEIMKETPSEKNINDYKQAKERYSKAKDKFKDSAEKFVNAKSTAEFKRNNVSIEIDRSQERFLKEDKRGWKSEKDIKREQKVIKKEQKEEIRAREKEKKEGREEKASHERISRFHERSSEFADSEKYFGSRDKRFEKQKESRFVDAPVTTLAVKEDTSLVMKETRDKKAKDAGKTGKAAIDKRFTDEKDSSIKINREQKKELDKAKQKAAKKEKNKALAKAGAVSAVSKMFKAKAAIQNDIMREGNADDLIASGKSSVVSAMLKKINPKDILMEKLKQALRKMLLKLIPLLLVVCLSFVVASIPIITVGCIAAQSDSGDNTYDPSSPNAFTGGDGKEFSSLSSDKIDTIIKKVYKNYPEMDSKHEKALRYALSKVGCPYNQAYHSRCDVDIFDCSSLTYRSYKEIGVNISYHGASSAAEEARGLIADGKSVSGDYEPGDLIFWGGSANGRYLGIYHTAIYIGNGKMVEARGTKWGVVYCDVRNTGAIVAVCRPM